MTEYFAEKGKDSEQSQKSTTVTEDRETDRSKLDWKIKNPHWYPEKVREGRSTGQSTFINNNIRDISKHINSSSNKNWNNLTEGQRKALKDLKMDESIIIKPPDKGNGIVLMNRTDYDAACLETLQDETFYEKMSTDPNLKYRETLDRKITDMLNKGYIDEVEDTRLREGNRTSCFYGLPKVHKSFEKFPPLRPICSGYDSWTAKLSEWVDSFTKLAAIKTASYIKDTIEFVKHVASLNNKIKNKNDIFLVTMDVNSLYPNIDHDEGTAVCFEALEKRSNKTIPSKLISDLILFILKSNTLSFKGQYFHQIKGIAMGTLMAVNFANLFMSKFESKLLEDYAALYGKNPVSWVRFIDDIFFVWKDDLKSLNHFLSFCNSYATIKNYNSNIKFTLEYSSSNVVFLDTRVKIHDGSIITELYSKPTATHTYLHNSSDHPPHTLRSSPLSQFIRIKRISLSSRNIENTHWILFNVMSEEDIRKGGLHK